MLVAPRHRRVDLNPLGYQIGRGQGGEAEGETVGQLTYHA